VVTNTGPHVPFGAVAGLFEPFRRLDADRTSHRAGAGLGLSIVRSVAGAHGGEVAAVPNPGGGLRISVRLPGVWGIAPQTFPHSSRWELPTPEWRSGRMEETEGGNGACRQPSSRGEKPSR
jgi:hypothetical protein